MRINLDLGAAELGRHRRALLDEFVAAAAPAGRRGQPSASEALARLLDAFAHDRQRVVALYSDIMAIAAEAYALEGEEMARQAVETAPPPVPMLGKFRSERAAKTAADLTTNPFVVRYGDGSYDWFANGAAVGAAIGPDAFVQYDPTAYHIVARRVAGRGWKATNR